MSNLTYQKYPKLVLNCGTVHSLNLVFKQRGQRYIIGPTHDGTRAELKLGGGGSGFKNSASLLHVSTDKVFEGWLETDNGRYLSKESFCLNFCLYILKEKIGQLKLHLLRHFEVKILVPKSAHIYFIILQWIFLCSLYFFYYEPTFCCLVLFLRIELTFRFRIYPKPKPHRLRLL